MATYVTKYRASWQSAEGIGGYLYIDERDFNINPPITSDNIKLQDDAIDITNSFESTESPIIGLRCEFYILNNKDDYFELFELLTAYEKQFKIRVTVTQPVGQAATLFEGFLNVDTNDHGYLKFQTMRLVASSYLSKLSNVELDSVDTKQDRTFIDIIDEALRLTGSDYNIRVNCDLYAEGDTLASGKTLFNLNGVNTEVFWDSDVERMNALDVLSSILMPFNCFLYWWDGYWYIEQFSNIWQTSIDYVEYTTNTSYSPADTGSIVTLSRELLDVHDLVFKDTSQEINTIPALKKIEVKLNSEDSLLVNLLSRLPIQSTITEQLNNRGVLTGAEFPTDLDFREWTFFNDSRVSYEWSNSGTKTKGIQNSIKRTRGSDSVENGLQMATKFKSTVLAETEITVGFTYTDIDGELRDTAYGLNGKSENDLDLFYLDFFFCIYYESGGTKYFICYDEPTDTWYVDSAGQINWPSERAVKLKVEGSTFKKTVDGFKLSTSIPLGEVHSAVGGTTGHLITNEITEFTFVLIGEAMYKWINYPWPRSDEYDARYLPRNARFGDIFITTTNDLDFNLIEGVLNAYFLDKKELEFIIGDNSNLNYTNGILRGALLNQRTTEWNRNGMAVSRPLIEIFYIEKFRMYSATKQKIISAIHQVYFLKPFTLFTESKQADKKFILTNYSFQPSRDTGNVTLLEYDNGTEVTLINGN